VIYEFACLICLFHNLGEFACLICLEFACLICLFFEP
jgi:hypothetical protein